MIFEKIGPQHLERKAILFVRQSSAHQVLHNLESSALQYAMRDRLVALGWLRVDTVMTISDDQQQAGLRVPVSTGWWPRSASASLVPSQRGKSRASPATVAIGSRLSRCAVSSIRC